MYPEFSELISRLEVGMVYLVAGDEENPTAVLPADRDPAERYGHELIVGGVGLIIRAHEGPLIGSCAQLSQADLQSLQEAVISDRCCGVVPESIYINKGDGFVNEDFLDVDDRVRLRVDEFGVSAIVDEKYPMWPGMTEGEYKDSLRIFADNYGCQVTEVRYLTADGAPFSEVIPQFDSAVSSDPGWMEHFNGDAERLGRWVSRFNEKNVKIAGEMSHTVEVSLRSKSEGGTAKLLIDAGGALSDYLAARRGGDLTAETIVDLLRNGHVKSLIGREENSFLEVKSQLYNIDAPRPNGTKQKIELAQDVARFANGDTGAVLVLGYSERKDGESSYIDSFSGVRLSGFSASKYTAILDDRIVPEVSGLVVESVEIEAGIGVVFIYVPRQPGEMKPYIVHGAVVGDKVEGAFFSIVQRRGEGSIAVSAKQIHGYIVAGRAFLRGSKG